MNSKTIDRMTLMEKLGMKPGTIAGGPFPVLSEWVSTGGNEVEIVVDVHGENFVLYMTAEEMNKLEERDGVSMEPCPVWGTA